MATKDLGGKSKEQLLAEKMVFLQSKFISKVPDRLEELQTNTDDGNWEFLHDLGHKIKGTSACLGLDSFSAIGKAIQTASKDQDKVELASLKVQLANETDEWHSKKDLKAS